MEAEGLALPTEGLGIGQAIASFPLAVAMVVASSRVLAKL
jgi:hypothetical protein